jgi:DNA-binding NtrC family response regulator
VRLRILVVDDDSLVRKAVGRMLSAIADVDLASSVGDATARLAAATYDVVLSDDSMPDGSGRGLLSVVRDQYPRCRRLLMSGDDVTNDVDRPSYEAFIHKPFTATALVPLLRRH